MTTFHHIHMPVGGPLPPWTVPRTSQEGIELTSGLEVCWCGPKYIHCPRVGRNDPYPLYPNVGRETHAMATKKRFCLKVVHNLRSIVPIFA